MENKIDRSWMYSLLLLSSACLMIALFTGTRYVYGSEIDWFNQHSIIPEYFRQQFYETGRLLSEFAPHLGGGQNIFHFSYYGLLSPIILISYLLPNVSMQDYISISSVLLTLLSGQLCFFWLKRQPKNPDTVICRRFIISSRAAFVAALFFQFSSPLLYHSHKQIMFVNYMPFLILALWGVDIWFEKKRSFLLIISTFLMVMTSYFYSIGGLLVLTCYAIYIYVSSVSPKADLTKKQQIISNTFDFFRHGTAFALRLIIPVCMAAIILLPTFAAIKSGRIEQQQTKSLIHLLIPKSNLEFLLYSPYGIGLTGISLFAFLYLFFSSRKEDKILGGLTGCFFFIPLLLYYLNGGLYIRGKVLIPFLPLMTLILALFFTDLSARQKLSRRPTVVFLLLLAVLLLLDHTCLAFAFLADSLVLIWGIYHVRLGKSINYVLAPSIVFCLVLCFFVNHSDSLVTKEEMASLNASSKYNLFQTLENTDTPICRSQDLTFSGKSSNQIPNLNIYKTSLYTSTYSEDYNLFCHQYMGNANDATNAISITESGNPLFQTFMGIRYLLTDNPDSVPFGYSLINEENGYFLYENPDVFPIGFASSSLMSKSDFTELSAFEQATALLSSIIVEKDEIPNTFESPLREESAKNLFSPLIPAGSDKTQVLLTSELSSIPQTYAADDNYTVRSDTPFTLTHMLDFSLNERLLLLQFDFSGPAEHPIRIAANHSINYLTSKSSIYPNHNLNFTYPVSSDKENRLLTLSFSAGEYTLYHPKMYSLDNAFIQNASSHLTALDIENYSSSDTVLSGRLTAEDNGYFTATIPYDKGFTAYVDGKEQEIEKVNCAFLGFPITRGSHHISLVYHSPYLKEGKLISLAALLMFLLILLWESVHRIRRQA